MLGDLRSNLKDYGARVKSSMNDLGFATLGDLCVAVESRGLGISLEVFTKLLNGRWDSRAYDVLSSIVEIFAERHRSLWPTVHPEAVRVKYQKLVFGENVNQPPLNTTEDDVLAPSFERLQLPTRPSSMADRFLDAMPPTLADIAANFDTPRAEFVRPNGLRDTVLNWLTTEGGSLLISVSGSSGSGKTVLSLRLAHECLSRGYRVFKLLPDWLCSDALGIQMRRLLNSSDQPTLFLFDDAGGLQQKNVDLRSLVRTISSIATSSVVLCLENWRLFTPFPSDAGPIAQTPHFTISALTKPELEALLDRIISLETSGRVQDIRCELSRSSRLALCQDERDRLIAAALLVLRYGRQVGTILEDEYKAISDEALRQAYLSTIIVAGLRLAIPRSIIGKLRIDRENPGTQFWGRLAQLTAQENESVSLRHPLFFRYLAPLAIANPDDRVDLFTHILSHVDPDDPLELNFGLDVFDRPKQISQLFYGEKSAIDRFISKIELRLPKLPSLLQRNVALSLAHLSRFNLNDCDRAHMLFEMAVACDRRHGYSYRQRSWNLLKGGRLTDAESSAIDAVRMLPEDPKTLSAAATILQYCSLKGFLDAGAIYAKALATSTDDSEFQEGLEKRIERYHEARRLLTYFSSVVELPKPVLEALKAPWFVWRMRKQLKDFLPAAKNKLGALLRDSDPDLDEFTDLVEDLDAKGDRVLIALIEGNSARIQYQQWYQTGKQVDLDSVENLFLSALKKLGAVSSMAESAPFIRTWYGTFLKEARRNFEGAEKEYRRAIKDAATIPGRNNDRPLRNDPMLLNNLALLLLHKARTNADFLTEAEVLLVTACEEVKRKKSRFTWPFDSLQELNLLKAETQSAASTVARD